MSPTGRPEGEHRSAQREGTPVTGSETTAGPAATAPTPAAARAAQERHLLRQIRGVVGLVLVLAAALAGLSFFPDTRHERIDRTPPPAGTQGSAGGAAPDTTAPPAPNAVKTDAGTPVAPPPAAAASAPGPDPAPPTPTTAPGPATAATTGTAMPAPPPPPATAAPADAPTTAAAPAAPGAAPSPAPAAPAKSDDGPPGPRHYVTFGTFAQPASAEALRARLEAQGIPTVLEARLRVGPFATREEAQAAQARLKDLGFAPGAVLSPRR